MKEALLPVTLHVGREGLTDALVQETRAQLRKRTVIKARRVSTGSDGRTPEEFWADLAHRTDARVLDVRGHTAILAHPSYGPGRPRPGNARRGRC